jgi:cysteine desulfuration protein SufE
MQYDDFSPVNLEQLINAANWQEKYRLILQWSNCITHKPQLHKNENYLQGCEVASWIKIDKQELTRRFSFDSHSKVIKGLAAIILVQLDGQTLDFIREWDETSFFERTHLQKYLTPSRNNGLKALIRACKEAQ